VGGPETKDAIRDHDDIRDGLRHAAQHPVGSQEWWQAVPGTRVANSDHMAEEEREALPDFRRHAAGCHRGPGQADWARRAAASNSRACTKAWGALPRNWR
jgi:hypothetical protein